jgi:hypothetical protein
MFLFIDLQIIQFFRKTVTLKYLFFFEKRGTAAPSTYPINSAYTPK